MISHLNLPQTNRRNRFRLAAALLLTAGFFGLNASLALSDETPVTLSAALADNAPVMPGSKVIVEVTADVSVEPDSKGKHWHFYPRKEQHKGVETPTSIAVTSASKNLVLGDIDWPATKITRNAFGEFQPVYEGRVTFKVPVSVAISATPGDHRLAIAFTYQTCASLCLPPKTENLTVVLTVLPTSPRVPPASASPGDTVVSGVATKAEGPVTASLSSSVATPGNVSVPPETGTSAEIHPPELAESRVVDVGTENSAAADTFADFQTSVFGAKFGFSANSAFAIPMLLLFACVGGFLLNLTPCVLPIIPIKIMGLTQSAAGDSHRAKVLGVAMGVGILAFWLAIGAAISFVSGFDSISSLFQRPVFGITVGLFIAVMGVGMLVDISVQLPQAVHRINPKHDTLHGAFLFGVMTAVLSTPCTAPFMGSAAAWATKANNSALVIAVFAAIAVGMGWPYVLLSWFPKFVSKVPRTGPASVLVKQAMGLLMLAVAAFFGGTGVLGLVKEHPHLGPVLHWWVATIFVGAMSVWMTLQTFRITRSPIKRIGYSFMSLALFSGMTIWSNGETADSWEATEMHQVQEDSLRAYVSQLEQTVRDGSGQQALQHRAPAWRDYDPEALARVKANGQIAIVHFTADW